MLKTSQSLKKFGVLTPIFAALALSACVTTSPPQDAGIGYREARFAEMTAIREYRSCRDDGFALGRQARETGDAAKYLASARLLSSCEANLGEETSGIAMNERFQSYALSVQNYLKGGDVQQARENLDRLTGRFPGKDLYYPDGSSFIDTMEMLLGLLPDHAAGRLSTANVNSDLKAEMRRVQYWKTH